MSESSQHTPTPRFKYEGEEHPVTKQRVFRQDAVGYRHARRTIAVETPNHPCLRDTSLWPDLQQRS